MTDWSFDREAIRAFRFVRCEFDAATGVARLAYAFDDGPELVETVTIPGAPFELDEARAAATERALRLLHLIAGVSYYKAAVPPEIRIDGYAIDAATGNCCRPSIGTGSANSPTATASIWTGASVFPRTR